MKFSGHETFPVREGWLHKGMKLVKEDPGLFLDEEVSDHLGVGRNMAKSIRHWLQVTGLAEPIGEEAKGRKTQLQLTRLGETIWDHDPFFLEPGTWWILHINLVNEDSGASTWAWFFNNFSHDRFDRAVCLENLRRHIESSQKRVPSAATIGRDLGCMLLSYARTIPSVQDDPEDGADCPFRNLGLLSYYKSSGYYQRHQEPKEIPPDIFGYAMSQAFGDMMQHTKRADIKLVDVARKAGGPGRAFCLNGESLFEVVSRIEADSSQNEIQIAGIAGDRAIRLHNMPSFDWVAQFYMSITEEAHA